MESGASSRRIGRSFGRAPVTRCEKSTDKKDCLNYVILLDGLAKCSPFCVRAKRQTLTSKSEKRDAAIPLSLSLSLGCNYQASNPRSTEQSIVRLTDRPANSQSDSRARVYYVLRLQERVVTSAASAAIRASFSAAASFLHVGGRARERNNSAENENDRHERNESIMKATKENYRLSRDITTLWPRYTGRIIFGYLSYVS